MTVVVTLANGGVMHIEAQAGESLMQVLRRNGVAGIWADCGGACSCATCHCVIEESWATIVGVPSPTEQEMLNLVADRTSHSRLSCQIRMTSTLDGMRIRVPG